MAYRSSGALRSASAVAVSQLARTRPIVARSPGQDQRAETSARYRIPKTRERPLVMLRPTRLRLTVALVSRKNWFSGKAEGKRVNASTRAKTNRPVAGALPYGSRRVSEARVHAGRNGKLARKGVRVKVAIPTSLPPKFLAYAGES